ncbi:MAG: sulfatase-like hydrolase/transferase [Xanthobacteraceae bacterium]
MLRFAILGALNLAALITNYITEYSIFSFSLALLTWGLINCIFLVMLRRPGIAAALSLALFALLITLSQFKFGIVYMTATFLDVMVIDSDTISFLGQIFPQLSTFLLVAALLGIPALLLIWRLDPIRVPRWMSLVGAAICVMGIVPMSLAVPEEGWEPFQGINHISNFSRSGVYALSQLLANGWIDAADKVTDPVPVTGGEPCHPQRKLPHIVVVLDESSFNAAKAPGVKLPSDYESHFRSFDGKMRSLRVEATGGPTWYSEYNLLTGLSARSYGKLMYYVTRIAAERVTRGLPHALARCGYNTFTLYPAFGNFLSARRFQTGTGIKHFIDQHGMGAVVEMHPDRFFYGKTVELIAREHAKAPLFVFTYLTANHFPWTVEFRPELTPEWQAPGNTPEIDEYLRRQTMSAHDYQAFVARLKQEFPGEPFLIVRFGDHQPAISSKMLEPNGDPGEIARRVMNYDPEFFTTHYVIDTVNFKPADLAAAQETLEGVYLPLIIQELAGVPLDPSFVEQKKIMQRCEGEFFTCDGGAEARRFNRLLMDAGLIRGL